MSRGEGAPDGGEIANESEILKRNVENENGNPAMARAGHLQTSLSNGGVLSEICSDPQRAAASGCGNPACATDKKEEGKEEVAEKAEDTDSSSSLEDGEIRDDPSGVPSDHESCDSWPENYIYPATSRCRGYLIDPFLHYRAGAGQSTYSNSRDSDTGSHCLPPISY